MKEKIEELIKILERGGLSIQYIADAMEGIYSSYYSEQDKNHFLDGAVNALARRFMARREEFLTALKNSTSVGRDIREGQELLRSCGFTRLCTFRRKEPVWHEL